MSTIYKFGQLTSTGEDKPFTYSNTWAVEKTSTGLDRLVIAPASNHVQLMTALSELMQPPFWVLYVLVLSRTHEHREGRYQSAETLSREQLANFLDRFRNYFELDARHHIWIAEANGSSQLIYDRHNVIYAYGPLAEYGEKLLANGVQQAHQVIFPAPHSHHYNSEYDSEEAALIGFLDWKLSSLREGDDI